MKRKPTYVALSTINYQQNGYTEYARGHDKTEIAKMAEAQIEKDTHRQTLYQNLIVRSVSEAKRKGYI